MRAQLTVLALGAILALPFPAAAQTEAVVIRFVDALNQAASRAGARDSIPAVAAATFDQALRRLRAATGRADFTTLARTRRDSLASADWLDADDGLDRDQRWLLRFYGSYLEAGIEAATAAGDAEAKGVADAVQAFRSAQLSLAHQRTLERLRRYEIKFGPGSPRLNAFELLENFVVQSWPMFRPGEDGPSPWEIVSGYSTSYVTQVEGEGKVVSLIEAGLRHYDFGWKSENRGGLADYLRPRYWALGAAIAPERTGALRWPFEARPRWGAFLSYGDLKIAALRDRDDDWQVLVSRQVQLLPFVL